MLLAFLGSHPSWSLWTLNFLIKRGKWLDRSYLCSCAFVPTINDKNYFNFKVNFIKQNKLLDLFSSIFIFLYGINSRSGFNCLLNLLHLCYCIVHLLICKVWLLLVTKVQILTVLQWPDIPGIFFRYSQTGLSSSGQIFLEYISDIPRLDWPEMMAEGWELSVRWSDSL